ncbi:hypothetical protein [Rhizobium sophoriradicis]|uniref:hypothetical protein n=1 Tax=Rhizobium sophoriradicis TaxID=1535245 RepID=UPI0011421FD6|nr:hypothetical protein [Rhizobium sophoriradicis]
MEAHVFAKQNHREENRFAGFENRRPGFEIRCGHQVRRAFALMAATVSLPENRRNAGRTSASRKKGQKKVTGKTKS